LLTQRIDNANSLKFLKNVKIPNKKSNLNPNPTGSEKYTRKYYA